MPLFLTYSRAKLLSLREYTHLESLLVYGSILDSPTITIFLSLTNTRRFIYYTKSCNKIQRKQRRVLLESAFEKWHRKKEKRARMKTIVSHMKRGVLHRVFLTWRECNEPIL